jgi:hypothetical protein
VVYFRDDARGTGWDAEKEWYGPFTREALLAAPV